MVHVSTTCGEAQNINTVRSSRSRHGIGHKRGQATASSTGEFLSFLCQIDRAYPGQELHLVMDNYATHKTAEVCEWLEAYPRFHVHFTPTSGPWLNLVEVWFGIIDRQAIKRGVFTSVKDLNKKIREFITGWNKRKHPLVWTKTPEQVLAKAKRKPTSET